MIIIELSCSCHTPKKINYYCMKKYILFTFLLAFAAIGTAHAQNNKTFTVEGTVVLKSTGEPISYAQIVLKEISQWGFTDEKGHFRISGVLPGQYTLESVALGYVTYQLPVVVKKDIQSIFIRMEEDNLTLKEVVVTATKGGSINSSDKIDKMAIEHLQASSISDVMQLIPGSVVTNPNLTTKNVLSIRGFNNGSNNENNYRGTALMINGAQMSSDASVFSNTSGLASVPQTDYRAYSTDNIESVEVLKGVVSAEYGDITSGAVLVTTKAGRTPYEVRFKTDPKTKAVSANKGFSLGKERGYMNIDADYARAASDMRSPVNTFDRTNIGITYSNTFSKHNRPFRFNARITGSFIYNNEKSDPDAGKVDFSKTKNSEIGASLYGTWMLNKSWISTLTYNLTGRYAKNNYREYTAIAGDIAPTTNTKKEGIAEGYFTAGVYNQDMRVNEIPVYVNAKVSGSLNKKIGGALSRTAVGFEWNTKGNNGKGEYYIGEQPQNFRERKYSNIPFMNNLSAFAEEKVTIPTSKKTSLELSAGLRFTKMYIDNYNYDPTLDPRFNAKFNIIKGARKQLIREFAIRGGYGIMQKLPSLNMLYAGDFYKDYNVFQYVNSATNEKLSVIQTRINSELLDYELKPAKTKNMELGFDMNIGGVRLGITYYNEKMTNAVSQNAFYTSEPVKYYNSVASTTASPKFEDGKVWIKDNKGNYVENGYTEITEFYSNRRPDTRGKQNKWGIEYDIDFGRIKAINTSIIVNGAYNKQTNYTIGDAYNYIGGQDPLNAKKRFPYVSIFNGDADMSNGNNRDRLVTSINVITNIPKLRMVVSFTTQCVWMDRQWYKFDDNQIYEIDKNGNRVFGAYDKNRSDAIIYRDPSYYMDAAGNVHPFSDYYTTTDSQLKTTLGMMRLSTNKSYLFLKNAYNPYFMANIRITKEIGKYASISFYANNFTNSKPIIRNSARPNAIGDRKNSDIYFGAELRITL